MGDPEEMTQAEEEPKGGKGKLLIIILVVLFLIVGMVITFLMLKQGEAEDSAYDVEEQSTKDTMMVPLPEFTVNLPPDATNIMNVEITLEISARDDHSLQEAKKELASLSDENAATTKYPLIREAIANVLQSKTRTEYISEVGRKKIKTEIQNELNKRGPGAISLEMCKIERVIFSTPPLIQ